MASNNRNNVEKRVFDVNALAIFLVNGHPGFEYVSPIIEDGLRGVYVPVIMDILPLRAFWIMTRRWGFPEAECAKAIEHFIKNYDIPQYPALKRVTIMEGFRLANELKHDVFSCIYLALAKQEKAAGIVTTDTDFEKLCNQVELKYINPVPKETLKHFKDQNQ